MSQSRSRILAIALVLSLLLNLGALGVAARTLLHGRVDDIRIAQLREESGTWWAIAEMREALFQDDEAQLLHCVPR